MQRKPKITLKKTLSIHHESSQITMLCRPTRIAGRIHFHLVKIKKGILANLHARTVLLLFLPSFFYATQNRTKSYGIFVSALIYESQSHRRVSRGQMYFLAAERDYFLRGYKVEDDLWLLNLLLWIPLIFFFSCNI